MRLEHHLVGGYVRYISPYIIIIIINYPHFYGLKSLTISYVTMGGGVHRGSTLQTHEAMFQYRKLPVYSEKHGRCIFKPRPWIKSHLVILWSMKSWRLSYLLYMRSCHEYWLNKAKKNNYIGWMAGSQRVTATFVVQVPIAISPLLGAMKFAFSFVFAWSTGMNRTSHN